jgi:hypothetical protein
MTDSCPSYLDVPSRMPLSYPPGFGLLTQFDHPPVGDRPNYRLSESRGIRAVAPKSEQQTVTLDQR